MRYAYPRNAYTSKNKSKKKRRIIAASIASFLIGYCAQENYPTHSHPESYEPKSLTITYIEPALTSPPTEYESNLQHNAQPYSISKEEIVKYLHDLERTLGFKYGFLVAVAKHESGFNQKAKSHADAYGIMQVRRIAYEELKRVYSIAKTKINLYVDKDSLEWIDISSPNTYEEITFTPKGSTLPSQEKLDLMYIYAPFYLAYKELEIDKISWQDVVRNPYANMKVGALYMFLIKNDFRTLVVVKHNNRNLLLRRSEKVLKDKDHIRLIPETHYVYLWPIYNMGYTISKKLFSRHIFLENFKNKLPWETKVGLRKIKKYWNEIKKESFF